VNGLLESILRSLRGAVVVVDRELRILVWNNNAEDLWGLRSNEVENKHFLNLDIGLPVDQVKPLIRACLASPDAHREITVDAVNRRGRAIRCLVTCMPLLTSRDEVRGVIMTMEMTSERKGVGETAE
jgi:two-component system CheB/CheR fusion protein